MSQEKHICKVKKRAHFGVFVCFCRSSGHLGRDAQQPSGELGRKVRYRDKKGEHYPIAKTSLLSSSQAKKVSCLIFPHNQQYPLLIKAEEWECFPIPFLWGKCYIWLLKIRIRIRYKQSIDQILSMVRLFQSRKRKSTSLKLN